MMYKLRSEDYYQEIIYNLKDWCALSRRERYMIRLNTPRIYYDKETPKE